MSAKVETLQRLVKLYGVVERMRLLELEQTVAALRETEEALSKQEKAQRIAGSDGREALRISDTMSWSVAEMQGETAAWRRLQLNELRVSRTVERDALRRTYLASRLESEQVQHVLSEAIRHDEVERARREQAEADDRFLARRRWKEARGEREFGDVDKGILTEPE